VAGVEAGRAEAANPVAVHPSEELAHGTSGVADVGWLRRTGGEQDE